MDPPKLTRKKWRAYCAFRKLDTSGKSEEMQNRLRDYLKAKKRGLAESSDPSSGFELILVMPTSVGASQRKWQERNEAERNRLWEMLSTEQKQGKDLLRVLEETVRAKSPGQDVWSFKTCRELPNKNWLEVSKALGCSDIGFIFTIFPPSPGGAPVDTKYQRGSTEGASWLSVDEDCKNYKFQGLGSGFEKGLIFGKTRALVKQKVDEICEQIKCDTIKGYVQKIRNSVAGAGAASR